MITSSRVSLLLEHRRPLSLHRGLPRYSTRSILLVLSALVFVRIGYVYPSRTPSLRGLTIALGLVWAGMIAAIIVMLPA